MVAPQTDELLLQFKLRDLCRGDNDSPLQGELRRPAQWQWYSRGHTIDSRGRERAQPDTQKGQVYVDCGFYGFYLSESDYQNLQTKERKPGFQLRLSERVSGIRMALKKRGRCPSGAIDDSRWI